VLVLQPLSYSPILGGYFASSSSQKRLKTLEGIQEKQQKKTQTKQNKIIIKKSQSKHQNHAITETHILMV